MKMTIYVPDDLADELSQRPGLNTSRRLPAGTARSRCQQRPRVCGRCFHPHRRCLFHGALDGAGPDRDEDR